MLLKFVIRIFDENFEKKHAFYGVLSINYISVVLVDISDENWYAVQ